MSTFLGPVHYWMYDKIGYQEGLTRAAVNAAEEAGAKLAGEYTKEDFPDIRNVIDEDNIHGWLQSRIDDAENRFMNLLADAQKEGVIDDVRDAAYEYGREHSILEGLLDGPVPGMKHDPDQKINAAVIYNQFENFFVNGMPCDNVNLTVNNDPEDFEWVMNVDIHAPYCDNAGIGSDLYYSVRKRVMDGMIDGSGYKVETPDNIHYAVKHE